MGWGSGAAKVGAVSGVAGAVEGVEDGGVCARMGAVSLYAVDTCAPIHVCMYTYIHIFIYTYVHIYVYTYMHIYIHTYIHTYTHTYTHIHIYTHIDI